MKPPDQGYDGPARVVAGDREVRVHATLSGHFEPVSGRYQWAGRVRPEDADAGEVLTPSTSVEVRTVDGAAEATVREVDPWGGLRVSGTGRPPFAVPSESP